MVSVTTYLAPLTMNTTVSGFSWIRSMRSALIAKRVVLSLVTTIMFTRPFTGHSRQKRRRR